MSVTDNMAPHLLSFLPQTSSHLDILSACCYPKTVDLPLNDTLETADAAICF